MDSFEYWYDRSQKVGVIVIGIGLVCWLVFSAYFPSPYSNNEPSNIIFLLPFFIPIGFFVADAISKYRVDGPAIEGDEYGLIIRGSWSKTYELAWNEISSIRFYQENDFPFGSRTYGYNDKQRLSISHFQSSDDIILKLYEIDGDHEDILADIMALAPSYVAVFYEAF